MRVLVVLADPDDDTLLRYAHAEMVKALGACDHTVESLDLAALGFDPAMTTEERRRYETDSPIVDPVVRRHADLLGWAEALVFVYPSRPWGMPALLKGWLDRVFVMGVAFRLSRRRNKVVPGLRHVKRLVAVTVHETSRVRIGVRGDPGRRTIMRTVRLLCHPLARRHWIAIYGPALAEEEARRRFVHRAVAVMEGL